MLVAIPALFLLFAWLAAASRLGLRQGFVVATVAYTVGVVVATEALSLTGWLRLPGVLAFWATVTVAAFWCWWRRDARTRHDALLTGLRGFGDAWAARRIELCGMAIVLGIVLLTGLLWPPNNWESMAYRMMRVVMWMQQGSVDHYATPYLPQLYHPPLASFHILHLQILAGGDRFANLPEWLALAGCGIAASLIAKELKGGLPTQVAAAVLAVTLPMGIMQGSSTQGNVLAAYWLLCFVLLLVWHLKTPAPWRLACCGLAAGFAVLAKPMTYLVLPPVAAALGFYALAVRWPARRAIVTLGTVAAIAVAVNLGHYVRNMQVFGEPISPAEAHDQINERLDATVLVSNLLRNSLLHWGLPSADANAWLLDAATAVLGGMPEPAAATAGRTLAATGIPHRFKEEDGPNMLHHWLLAIAVVGLCMRRWRQRSPPLTSYLVGGWIAAVVAFSAILQWQQWNSRYHVMLFMLGAPLTAVFLNHALPPCRRAVSGGGEVRRADWPLRVVCGVFLLAATPWLLFKESAPWLRLDRSDATLPVEVLLGTDRTAAYFNNIGRSHTHDALVALANQVAKLGSTEVGLMVDPSLQGVEFGYPLHVLLGERVPRIVYYDVWRDHPTWPLQGEPPAVAVKTGEGWGERDHRWNYRRVWTHPSLPISVWRRVPTPLLRLSARELRQRWSKEVEAAICKAARGVNGPGAAVVDDLLLYIVARRPGADGRRASVRCGGQDWHLTTEPSAPVAGRVNEAGLETASVSSPEEQVAALVLASEPGSNAAGTARYEIVIPLNNRLAKHYLSTHDILAVALARERPSTLRLTDVTDNGRVIREHELALPAPADLPGDEA